MLDNVKLNKVVGIKKSGRVCKTYDIEVDSTFHAFVAKHKSGGVGISHNSALISLSNLSDQRMRDAKTGQWWIEHPEFALANNSIAYTEKPDVETFLQEWYSLVKSKSGERGIFNRVAAQKQAAKWGKRDETLAYGCNP